MGVVGMHRRKIVAEHKNPEVNSNDASPDCDERIEDFYTRHGGRAQRATETNEVQAGFRGWSLVFAADGYALRCDWENMGGHREMRYSEIPPT